MRVCIHVLAPVDWEVCQEEEGDTATFQESENHVLISFGQNSKEEPVILVSDVTTYITRNAVSVSSQSNAEKGRSKFVLTLPLLAFLAFFMQTIMK